VSGEDLLPRVKFVPRLDVSQTPERRSALKEEVAERIQELLQRSENSYARVGGLNRLVSQVAEESGWSRADVYNALLRADVDVDLAEQTIKPR
jgi:DNA-binding phage protein